MRCAFLVAWLFAAPAMFADIVKDLLELPAPAPVFEITAPERSDPPPDDAPFDELAGWWASAYYNTINVAPSMTVRERLVEVIEKRPDLLPGVVDLLPVRPQVCAAVKSALGQGYDGPMEKWLLHRCPMERERLAELALQAADELDTGTVQGSDAMLALVKADPKRAETVLQQLVGSAQPRTRALALSLLFEQSSGLARGEYHCALQAIATDSRAPSYARHRAIGTLAAAEWPGRDDWLLSLVRDGSLLETRDGYSTYEPVRDFVAKDPDLWIPIMVELLESPIRSTRSLAANALGQFHLPDYVRKDALLPLLPWLGNPEWADDRSMTRLRLIQIAGDLGLTSAIPDLAWIVQHDRDESCRIYAAAALGQFHDPRANDAIRQLFEHMDNHFEHDTVIRALIGTGGFSAADLARGLEALFVVPYGAADHPPQVSVGFYVREHCRDRDDVARLVIARAEEVRKEQPKLSAELLGVVQSWPVPASAELVISRIQDGTADAAMIAAALEQRESLRLSQSRALLRLRAASGVRSGIATVILGDVPDELRLLAGDDLDAKRALLAAARLVREELPVAEVVSLFGCSKLIDEAAEAFLIADDGIAARAAVRQRYPWEILILGSYGGAPWEEDALRRFIEWDLDELIVLGMSAWPDDFLEIEISRGRATLVVTGEVKTLRAVLPTAVTDDLLTFLATSRFDDLGPLDTKTLNGLHCEYLHLTRAGGRRVVMNNPKVAPGSPYDELVRRLMAIAVTTFTELK